MTTPPIPDGAIDAAQKERVNAVSPWAPLQPEGHYAQLYALQFAKEQNGELEKEIQTLRKAQDVSAVTMKSLALRKIQFEQALNRVLECSNGHFNPMFKCGCYTVAHDTCDQPFVDEALAASAAIYDATIAKEVRRKA